MLTQNQIIKLYSGGVELKFKKGSNPDSDAGRYHPDSLEIIIYTSNLKSIYEKEITILHEFIHARDDFLKSKQYDRPDEEIEKEAVKTYSKKPEVLPFLKLIYAF